jgi:HD-GYP domain-containing protein (c-di-GMP phosphodiesterase class II)
MTAAASASSLSNPAVRPLPLVIYFEGDERVRQVLNGLHRYRRMPYDALDREAQEIERVVIASSQAQLERHYNALRKPNVRVIGMCENRFRDARMDGAVYAYLPPTTPLSLLERMIDNAIDHIQLLSNRNELNDRLTMASREIQELNQIGAALSAEHNTSTLLEMILTKSREITKSDAGSLYLVEDTEPHKTDLVELGAHPEGSSAASTAAAKLVRKSDGRKRLRFKLAQNDTVFIPFKELTMEIDDHSIAGYVALTGSSVNIEDAYHMTEAAPYKINRAFDEESGYRTKSILAVPMRNQKDEIVGVLQLINAKRDFNLKLNTLSTVLQQVVPFIDRQRAIVESLASQAAVALENSELYEAIQRLFEGFVRASVIAIEARDPTTSGHSFRVANLTVALAEAADRADSGPFANLKFSRNEMKEIRYASLLHDFGKVGVREEVLVKARKLYPAQMELIQQRFQFVKQSMEAESLRERLKFVLEKNRDAYLKKLPEFDEKLQEHFKELDDYFATVVRSDEPTVLPEGSFEQLLGIAARHYIDLTGEDRPLLTNDEVRLLSIRKGSLDESERLQIESHVNHTFNFLQQIPWTKEIKGIPAIARGHHEKLNGRGYPYKLSAPEIPVQTRMMTVSDIFDALSASDRPYKKAVTLERALEILGFAVKDGEVDGSVFELFKDGKVWEKWKVEPYPY